MRILVCGGRDYADYALLAHVLDHVPDDATIVHGAARGADAMAHRYALDRPLAVEAHPANWGLHGRAAGPIRNREMLDTGTDLVITMP